jgi:prepilin-type N-terminal cleavage/methylation domain-containing protein
MKMKSGFTLIELSIVLVIIGLIVGVILVGRDLIDAAAIRAQISQIEKFNAAVNVFRIKYGGLPGDLSSDTAAAFGFTARSGAQGEGDGNGILENTLGNNEYLLEGEYGLFWVDLGQSGLIQGSFTNAGITNCPAFIPSAALSQYLPPAQIGQGNFVYVWSGGVSAAGHYDGNNYFGIEYIDSINGACAVNSEPAGTLTATQAYAMDSKIDDGFPETGTVQATEVFANEAVYEMWDGGAADTITDTPPSPTSCYDDGGVTGAKRKYSLGTNGSAPNCALSIRFQ